MDSFLGLIGKILAQTGLFAVVVITLFLIADATKKKMGIFTILYGGFQIVYHVIAYGFNGYVIALCVFLFLLTTIAYYIVYDAHLEKPEEQQAEQQPQQSAAAPPPPAPVYQKAATESNEDTNGISLSNVPIPIGTVSASGVPEDFNMNINSNNQSYTFHSVNGQICSVSINGKTIQYN